MESTGGSSSGTGCGLLKASADEAGHLCTVCSRCGGTSGLLCCVQCGIGGAAGAGLGRELNSCRLTGRQGQGSSQLLFSCCMETVTAGAVLPYLLCCCIFPKGSHVITDRSDAKPLDRRCCTDPICAPVIAPLESGTGGLGAKIILPGSGGPIAAPSRAHHFFPSKERGFHGWPQAMA